MYYKHRFMKPQASHCMSTSSSILKSQLKRMLITHVTVNMSFINNGLLLETMNMFFLFINNGPMVCGKVS